MTARIRQLHTGHLIALPATQAKPQPARRGVNLTKRLAARWVEPANYPRLREAAATAALYAGALGFNAPYTTWTGLSDGTATTLLEDGTRLLHTPDSQHTNLTVMERCPRGEWHLRPITAPDQLPLIHADIAACTHHTPDYDQPKEHPHD